MNTGAESLSDDWSKERGTGDSRGKEKLRLYKRSPMETYLVSDLKI